MVVRLHTCEARKTKGFERLAGVVPWLGMCLIVFALNAHPRYPVVVAANRDEFHDRPTDPVHFWPDAPQLLAGRDREGGGTWLGLTTGGRIAALTNFREPGRRLDDAPSRGTLVADFLKGEASPAEYLEEIAARGAAFNGFNLVLGVGTEWWYYSNRGGAPKPLEAGVYGLSNHLLDTPWPKLERTRKGLAAALENPWELNLEQLELLMADRSRAPDHELPGTGVPLEWERILSAPCIVSPDYGTRSTTLLSIDHEQSARLVEHTRNRAGRIASSLHFELDLD